MTFPEEKHLPDDGQQPLKQSGRPLPTDQTIPPFPVPDTDVEFDFEQGQEDLAAFRHRLEEIDFQPQPFSMPEVPARPRSARRQRGNRLLKRPDSSELGERLELIARRASPTIDFFIFSFLSGCVLAVGYLLNVPAFLLLGIVAAPLMAPWIGVMMAAAIGETRFLGQTLGGFFTVILLIFGLGVLGGFASRLFQPMDSTQALLHARLWWPDLFLLLLGTAVLAISFIQGEDKPLLASLMVAYEFFLPVSAAGFGMGSGVAGLWPQAGLVFFIHLALALIIGLLVIFYMGFRPLELQGYAYAGLSVIASVALVAGFLLLGNRIQLPSLPAATEIPSPYPTALPLVVPSKTVTATLTHLPTRTPAVKLATVTPTPVPASLTPTVILALDVTASPESPLLTPLPTPVYGRIESTTGGVTIRIKPDGYGITTILNGYLAEFLPEAPVTFNGEVWVKVLIRTPGKDIEGWVLRDSIITATPSGAP